MGQQPLICLIHGHGVDASIWDGIYADLSLANPVLQPDFSRLTHLRSIEAYADALYAQVRPLPAEGIILVGHSMGGYMALAYAERYPDKVQGLVLYHSTATADDAARRVVRQQTIDEIEKYGTAPFIRKQLPRMVAPDYPPERTQALVEQFSALPAEALVAGINAMAGRPDRTHVLQQADFPVLLVLGTEDQLLPYEKTAALANLSNTIRVATLEQAGHLSMLEQPTESIRVLRSFVSLR